MASRVEFRWICEDCGKKGPIITKDNFQQFLDECNKGRTELLRIEDRTQISDKTTEAEFVARLHSVIFHDGHTVGIQENTILDFTSGPAKEVLEKALARKGC